MHNPTARDRFAEANGWRHSRSHFTLDALIKGMMHGGRQDRELIGDLHWRPLNHRESFRLPASQGVRPVAIMAHNYEDGADELRKLVADLAGALVLHEAPAGKAASWYLPGGTLPMVVTRPGAVVVWPTLEEMADIAAAYAAEVEGQAAADLNWRNLSAADIDKSLRKLALR
jgi:hypothetical protein